MFTSINSKKKPHFAVIAICGSMRFTKEMIRLQDVLSKEGKICLLPAFDINDDGRNIDPLLKEQYKFMHFQRIDMSDEIYVVAVDNYIGESTQLEIDYAKKLNKKVNIINY